MEIRGDVTRVARQPVRRQIFDDAGHDVGKLGQPAGERELCGMNERRERGQSALATSSASARRKTDAIRAWPYWT